MRDILGLPSRASGMPASIDSLRSPCSLSVISVSMKPGAMQLTVIPREAKFASSRFGQADHARLGRHIIGLSRIAQ